MTDPLRTIRLGETPAPTHRVHAPVCAMKILATDEIGSHGRVTVILNGEPAHVEVPPPGPWWGDCPPVQGDMLVIAAGGRISHRPAELFAAESEPIRRGESVPYRDWGRSVAFEG